MGKRICFWGVLPAKHWVHWRHDLSLVVPCNKVLALPLFAVSWALFNVWRVAFRQAGCLRVRNEEHEEMKKTDGFAMFRQEKGGCTICFCVLVDQRRGC